MLASNSRADLQGRNSDKQPELLTGVGVRASGGARRTVIHRQLLGADAVLTELLDGALEPNSRDSLAAARASAPREAYGRTR